MSFLEVLQQQPVWFFTSIFILGLLVGSFLNVVIYRYPIILKRQWKEECTEFLELDCKQLDKDSRFNLLFPPSRCPECQHKIRAIENIPVLSWLFLRGKCSSCKSKISPRYPLIEFTTALLSLLIAWKFGYGLYTLCLLGLSWSLICLSIIDYDTQLLPDDITLPLLWSGLLCSLLAITPVSVNDALLGCILGYLSLWSVYKVFKLLTGKEGMGYGDFKLLAALGAWLGWQMLPIIIFLSAFVGAIVGISLMIFLGRDRNIPIPFGPYLASAGFLAVILGNDINQIYIKLLGIG